ncbi:MAG: corrinoid protein [Candidatus Sumerlaeaceae bacterium]|nr:corrinoid protein [Candidatus Sumerlaeaceae bacterium]
MADFQAIAEALIRGDHETVSTLTKAALDEGERAEVILEDGLIAGMKVIGVRFKNNEIFVPEVLVAARAMKAGLAHLEPIFAACGIEPCGRFLIGTVKGDIHDIGKNLVGMMLKGAGFEVIDLGVNTSLQKFVDAIEQYKPHLVGMSALLTTTMGQMKVNIDAFREKGYLDRMKVMVGGAPVSREYAGKVGADGYGKDASEAVTVALQLLDQVKAAAQ